MRRWSVRGRGRAWPISALAQQQAVVEVLPDEADRTEAGRVDRADQLP
jgi:hypothetical protein